MPNNLDISCRLGGEDSTLFQRVVNQGIDARLEAFTKSNFFGKNGRLFLEIHPDEVALLLRRLCELNNIDADLWVRDIVESEYGVEVDF